MFLGTYWRKIEGKKGRIRLPDKFRKEMGDGVIIVQGFMACLYVYPINVFEQLIKELSQPPFKKGQGHLLRRMAGGAEEGTIDKQGRITIPPEFRKYASLNERVVVIGRVDRLEIWNERILEELKEKTENSLKKLPNLKERKSTNSIS